MLLYIFKYGRHRQVKSNPSAIDLLGIANEMLTIYKYDPKKGFLKLVIDQGKLFWVSITEGKPHTCQEGRLHQ